MRIENSIRNLKYNFFAQIIVNIIAFVSRTIFIKILGEEYLGISGLFNNILSILSLADMGIATVLIYSMYTPLANKDELKLKKLMNYYRKVYTMIALVVLSIGLLITPFIHLLIKNMPSIGNLQLIFILYLLNTVVTYLCVYKISIINADQKNYIVTYKQQIISIISTACMIVALILTRNFIIYLIVQIIFSIISNLYLSYTAQKLYPFIKDTKEYNLDKIDVKSLKKNTFAMLFHKIGGVVVNGTDSLIMSYFMGIQSVGIYSNYLLIIGTIKKFITQFFNSIVASIGNLNAEKDKEYSYIVFKRIFFINFWLYSFCTICLICLLNPFIKMWLGGQYLFTFDIVISICGIFYIDGMRQTVQSFKDSIGLFWKDRYKAIIEAIVNLVISIMLVKILGVIGIFLGTIISMFFISSWIEAYVLYKYGFKKKIQEYFKLYISYFVVFLIALVITKVLCSLIYTNSLMSFILCIIVTCTVSNVIIILFTSHMEEFKYFKNFLKEKIIKH